MSTNTPELTDDDRALYETFEKARAGSTRPVGTLRGIRAVLDKLRQGCEPVAWLHEDGSDVWTAYKKRNVACNGDAGAWMAACYNVPLVRYAAPQASDAVRLDADALDLARAGIELYSPGMPEHAVCAELVRLAAVLADRQQRAALASKEKIDE